MNKRMLLRILCVGVLLCLCVALPGLAEDRDTLTSGDGWMYRVLGDETVEVLGHADADAVRLSIPEWIEGRPVSAIGSHAFEANEQLERIFIPGLVTTIDATAFPEKRLTISGWNGSAGQRFAAKRGLRFSNNSEYDFFDDLIDLSEYSSANVSLVGNQLRVSMPYAGRLSPGTKVFIPGASRRSNGSPAEITGVQMEGAYALFSFRTLSFGEAVETFHAENVVLTPDFSNIVLYNGTTIQRDDESRVSLSKGSISLAIKLGFASVELGLENVSVECDVDYRDLQVKVLDMSSSIKAGVTVKGTLELINNRRFQLARIPLTAPGSLVSANLVVYLNISVQGEASLFLGIEYETGSRMVDGVVVSQYREFLPKAEFQTTVEGRASLEFGILVSLGFVIDNMSIDVAKLTAEGAFIVDAAFTDINEAPGCIDMSVRFEGSVYGKVGAFKDRTDDEFIVGKIEFLKWTSDDLFSAHFEAPLLKFTDHCEQLERTIVSFETNTDCSISPQKVRHGDRLAIPQLIFGADMQRVFVKEGYEFEGWYRDKDFSGEKWSFVDDLVPEVPTLKLYAHWVEVPEETPTPTPAPGETPTPAPTPTIDPSIPGNENINLVGEHPDSNYVLSDGTFTYKYVSGTQCSHAYGGITFLIASSPIEADTLRIDPVRYNSFWDEDHMIYSCDPNGSRVDKIHIPSGVFNQAKIKHLIIGKGVMIEPGAFANNPYLESVTFESTDWPNCRISEKAFFNCRNLKSVVISPKYRGYDIIDTDDYAFANCPSLKNISTPENCKLYLGPNTFTGCTGLESFYSPSETVLHDSCFRGCTSLTRVDCPNLQEISSDVFSGCTALQSISFSSISSIPSGTFKGCTSLKTVDLRSLKYVSESAFKDCVSLESVNLSNVDYVESGAFENCTTLTKLTLPNVTLINNGAFRGCSSLTQLELPNLQYISQNAFAGCSSLTHLELPNLRHMSLNSFDECVNLRELILSAETQNARLMLQTSPRLNLDKLVLPEQIESLVLKNTLIRELTLPKSIQYNGEDITTWLGKEINACEWPEKIHAYSGTEVVDYLRGRPEIRDFIELDLLDRPKVQVNFDTQDGSEVESQTVSASLWVREPEAPVRENYTFVGWSTKPEEMEEWDFVWDAVPEEGLTLYAIWEEGQNSVEEQKPSGFVTVDFGYRVTRLPNTPVCEVKAPDGMKADVLELTAVVGDLVEELILPGTLRSISSETFSGASSLKRIVINGDSEKYYTVNDVLFDRDGALVCYPCKKAATAQYTVPNGISVIADYAFYGAQIESLVFPQSVKEVRAQSLENMPQLASVKFASDPTFIDDNACWESTARFIGPDNAPHLEAWAERNDNLYNVSYVRFYAEDGKSGLLLSTMHKGDALPALSGPALEDKRFIGWLWEGRLWNYETDRIPAEDISLVAAYSPLYETEPDGDGVRILRYLGSDTSVRLPQTINGKAVASIANGAFPAGTTLIAEKGSAAQAYCKRSGNPFEAIVHTVSYETRGGSWVAPAMLCATDPIPLPELIRYGYAFEGWTYALSDAPTLLQPGETMPCSDIELFAVWRKVDGEVGCEEFSFVSAEAGYIITGYTGKSSSAEIPETINGGPVIAIAKQAFSGVTKLRRLTVPGCVASIGERAFENSALTEIVLKPGVERIGARAFSGCASLSAIEIPNTVSSLGEKAFSGCKSLSNVSLSALLTELPSGAFAGCKSLDFIQLPNRIARIGEDAFANCAELKSVVLGAGLSEIGKNAFRGCSALQWIEIYAQNPYLKTIDNVIFSKDGTTLLLYPEGKVDSTYSIPQSTLAIGSGAMANSRIFRLEGGRNLKMIGDGALSNCSKLVVISFDSGCSLGWIGDSAFSGCSSLKWISLPEALTSIGSSAFSWCGSLRGITLPENVQSVGSDLLTGTTALLVCAPDTQTTRTMQSAGYRTFQLLGHFPIQRIPASIQVIEREAFAEAAFTSIEIPESCESIEDYAFYNCDKLSVIHICGINTMIDPQAFEGCSSLACIYGKVGSVAEQYAAMHQLVFIPDDF